MPAPLAAWRVRAVRTGRVPTSWTIAWPMREAARAPARCPRREAVHDPLDTLKQSVEPNAATNLRFRTTYQH